MVLSTACEHTYMLRASKTIESGAQQQKPYKCTISVTVADYQGSRCHTPIPIVHRFPFMIYCYCVTYNVHIFSYS